jgi:hypothetical protein
MVEITLSILGVLGTLSSIIFAYLAFRRNDKKDIKIHATQEAEIVADMKWLKSSVSRMEKKINEIDDNYKELGITVIKVKERLDNHIRCEK